MHCPTVLAGLATLFAATPAFAASDMAVVLVSPAPVHVYDTTTFVAAVTNVGDAPASGVRLEVVLPSTARAELMGEVAMLDSRCVVRGARLSCALGTMASNATTAIAFGLDFPWTEAKLAIDATATTRSREANRLNNRAGVTARQLYYPFAVSDDTRAVVRRCAGEGLTSYFECTLDPSGIREFELTFGARGALFSSTGDVVGKWTQTVGLATDPDSLMFSILEDGAEIGTFEGYGTSPGCFEGIAAFYDETVEAYEVCM